MDMSDSQDYFLPDDGYQSLKKPIKRAQQPVKINLNSTKPRERKTNKLSKKELFASTKLKSYNEEI